MSDLYNEIKNDLDVNFSEEDKSVLEKIINKTLSIAGDFTNRETDDETLYPYVIDAVKAFYLRRGDEDKNSMAEGSESYTYKNIIKEMKEDLMSVRLLK